MRNVSKVWPGRLLAAVTVLALVLASAIGAYAHAAAHALPPAEGAEAVAGTAGHAGPHRHAPATETAAEPGHMGQGHGDGPGHGQEDDGAGQAHLECCDTICHGGQAILAPLAFALPPPHSAPVMNAVAAFLGAEPGGLDRPPKVSRPA
jgi:hypothetical protein